MAFHIRRVDYFATTVNDRPGEAYRLLTMLEEMGLNLLAFTAVPVSPVLTQLTLFPEDTAKMMSAARKAGMEVRGPHPALLVQGDDELGALADVHEKLFEANVNVFAATGVTDGTGAYGYIVYVESRDFDVALKALTG